MVPYIFTPPGGPNPFLIEEQTTPNFSIINWDYYDFDIENETVVYSKDILPYNEKTVEIYKKFIEDLKKNYSELIYTFERSQWTLGRLRLRVVINSESLAKNFESILPKLTKNNLIRDRLNLSIFEKVVYLQKTFFFDHFSKSECLIEKTINNLFELTNDYEKYAYYYLDALRLIKNNIRIVYKKNQLTEQQIDIKVSDYTLKLFNKHGFSTLKLAFLARCIFSGFFCVYRDSIKIPIKYQIPDLLEIRSKIFKQKYFKKYPNLSFQQY